KTRSYPDERVRQAARQTGARVTLIEADGVVLGDSQVAPERLATVENHGSRPEVVAARGDGIGFGERRSATGLEPFVYVARRVGPETAPLGYLRLAISQNDLDLLEAPFRGTLYQVSLAAGLLVGLLIIVIRQRHANDLARVRAGVAEAAEGRRPEPPPASSEETEEVFQALARFARLVAAEREGSAKVRLLARTVFEKVPIGLVVVDRTLALLDANPAALALFRAPAGAPRYALADLVRDPETLRLFEAGIRGEASSEENAVLRLGGESSPEQVLEVNVRAVPHGPAAGEPAAVGVVRDITERERTETMRRRFVSDVSHELRTPIAAIRAAVETLAGEEALPQIESGAVTLAIEPIALRPLLLSVVRDLASAAEARSVTVAVEAAENLGLSGDPRRISQVFRNLVDNAVKFSPAGQRVDVLAEGGAPNGAGGTTPVVVHVVDRGIGIPRTEQDRIFQRFYRVDPSRAKSVPGTGLGLAIVKHLLILHGGTIRVDSEPGKGSRFTVTLPAAALEDVTLERTKETS